MSDQTGLAAVHAAADSISRKDHDAAVAGARDEGRKAGLAEGEKAGRIAGAAAERDRLAGIDAAALPGHEKLVAECKADPACTPGDAALKINAAERAKLAAAHQSIKAVEGETDKVAASPAGDRRQDQQPKATTPDGWKAEWQASAELQREFAAVEDYVALKKAEASGVVKVFAPATRRAG